MPARAGIRCPAVRGLVQQVGKDRFRPIGHCLCGQLDDGGATSMEMVYEMTTSRSISI
ncbi:MAG: hypothetical protein ACRD1C_14350 [Terriglobales bacterium]